MTWQEEFKLIVFAGVLAFALILGMKALHFSSQVLAHGGGPAVERSAG
jgi:hypothetical protein